ncbi:MAG: MBL fold metallo-hydrolase [Bacteroidota bacterium]
MKLTFLGTGTSQGVPVIGCNCKVCISDDSRDQRLRTAVAVEIENQRIIIDVGPDFRQQMLRENIVSLNAILITHGHKDHLGGLDDVRAINYFARKPVDVYATREVQRVIKKEFSYAFTKNPYPGVPEIALHTITNKSFKLNNIDITPIKSLHYGKEQYVFGFRIEDLTYITDAVYIPEKEKQKIKGSKVVVLNALRKQKHYSHFNLSEALELMNEFSPEQGFLTHISHQLGAHNDVEQELPSNVKLAFDGLTITF